MYVYHSTPIGEVLTASGNDEVTISIFGQPGYLRNGPQQKDREMLLQHLQTWTLLLYIIMI